MCEGNIKREIVVQKIKVNEKIRKLHYLGFTFYTFLTSLDNEQYKLYFDILFV